MPNVTLYLDNETHAKFTLAKDEKKEKIKMKAKALFKDELDRL